MNALTAGIDAIYLFNFWYMPPEDQHWLLRQVGDPGILESLDTVYYPDPRGVDSMPASAWLKEGERYFTRPRVFSPDRPFHLRPGEPLNVALTIGHDLSRQRSPAMIPTVTLRIRGEGVVDVHDLSIELNGRRLGSCRRKNTWLHYPVNSEIVSTGVNQIVVVLDKKSRTKPLLHDIALSIRYPRHSGEYCK